METREVYSRPFFFCILETETMRTEAWCPFFFLLEIPIFFGNSFVIIFIPQRNAGVFQADIEIEGACQIPSLFYFFILFFCFTVKNPILK